MKPVQNFAERLKEILPTTGLSASELSRRMGFHSRNSVFRILNDEVSYEKQRTFLDKLKGMNILDLSPREWNELEEGLEVSRIGMDSFLSNKAMADLVMCSDKEMEKLEVLRYPEKRSDDISECLKEVFAGREGQMLITGCCDARLFQAIGWLLLTASKCGCEVGITHYIEVSGVELVRAVTAIQPVVYSGRYQAYILADKSVASELKNLYRGNRILAAYVDNAGCRHFLHLIMSDYGRVYCYEYENEKPFLFLKNVLEEHARDMEPIKTMFAQPASPEDYLCYTEQYRALEEGASLYDIKSDVPINYIHPDILLGSVVDGFKEAGFGKEDEQEQLIGQFYDVQLQRWKNFFEKRKVTHTIFTYASMRRFALTGRQSDHFFAMRPYTKPERRKILTFLREQTANNPYFTVYFFKQGIEPVQNEIGMYEGKGVLLTKANTDYKLDGEHAEALITQEEFCSRFKEYFLKQLLVHSVTSARETLAIMDELIALCDAEGEEQAVESGTE